MKFQFCGNLSCPEWFLAESANLAKVSSLKIKLILQSLINQIIDDVNYSTKIIGLLSSFNEEEINSILSSLEFILSNSIRFEIEDTILLKELIDLGLPKENCESIAKVFKDNKDKLKTKKIKTTPRLCRLESINFSINRMITSKIISRTPEALCKYADIKLKIDEGKTDDLIIKEKPKTVQFLIFKDKLLELISELDHAQKIMEKY